MICTRMCTQYELLSYVSQMEGLRLKTKNYQTRVWREQQELLHLLLHKFCRLTFSFEQTHERINIGNCSLQKLSTIRKHREISNLTKSRQSCSSGNLAKFWETPARHAVQLGDYFCHVEVRKTHSQVNIDASDAQRKPLYIRRHLVKSFPSFSLHLCVSQRTQDFENSFVLTYFGNHKWLHCHIYPK